MMGYLLTIDMINYRYIYGDMMGYVGYITCICIPLPSGKHTKNYGKSQFYSWVNPLFLWPFSIAM